MTRTGADDPIVAFYSGGPDHRGRTLEEILGWSDAALEAAHDYIQWLFPTPSPSGVNAHAPLVSAATRTVFAARLELRAALARSLERMLLFYGLRREAGGADDVRIVPDERRFAERADVWLFPGNHNHLRLTRIVQSLACLGLTAEAAALQRCLLADVAGGGRGRVTPETRRYWRGALRSPGGAR